MKKNKRIISIIVSTILIFTPALVNAVETNPTPTPAPTPSEEPTPSPTPSPEPSPSAEPTPTPTPSPSEAPVVKEVTLTLDKKEVTVEVGATVTINATVDPSDKKVTWATNNNGVATVSAGKITGVAVGTTTIVAEAEGKEVTCTVNVTKKTTKDPEYTIKELNLTNGSLDKSFNSKTLEYTVTVDSNITALKLKPELTDEDEVAQFLISGNNNLKDGSVVKIIVSDTETGKEKNVYQLTIVKDTVDLSLKSLKINGYALNEVFSPSTTLYTATIPYEISTLTIQAVATSSKANVSVSNTNDLKVGKNTITVTVKDNNNNTKNYIIEVTREEEVTVEENPTSIITSSETTSEESKEIIGVPSSSNDDFLKYFIVSLSCLILFAIGGIGIYFYIKTNPKKLKKEINTDGDDNQSSPIVEVEESNSNQPETPKKEEKPKIEIYETREFQIDELKNNEKLENLFDDEDV